jgi:excinuclease ABC subunit C
MLFQVLEFSAEQSSQTLEQIPASPAVFVIRGDAGSEPYVGKSSNLKRRLTRLLGQPEEHSKRLNLRDRCRAIEYQLTGSDFESWFLLYRVLRSEFPSRYRDKIKLRLAPLIKLNLENPYPRAYLTRRISNLRSRSLYFGPFPSRAAAERFMNDSLDFFKIRRCDFELNPDPSFPGCIYSEMKMCLAPCFKGCTDEEYVREVDRVRAYLESSGRSLVREISDHRDRASEELNFEDAAALHTRIEKVEALLGTSSLPELARPISQLTGVVVQRSPQQNCVALFRIDHGFISGPIVFGIEPKADERNKSMESRLAEALGSEAQAPLSAAELNEHIAILRRWYYRGRRTGEIFLCDQKGELPLRRIVRGIGRVYRGEQPDLTVETQSQGSTLPDNRAGSQS